MSTAVALLQLVAGLLLGGIGVALLVYAYRFAFRFDLILDELAELDRQHAAKERRRAFVRAFHAGEAK